MLSLGNLQTVAPYLWKDEENCATSLLVAFEQNIAPTDLDSMDMLADPSDSPREELMKIKVSGGKDDNQVIGDFIGFAQHTLEIHRYVGIRIETVNSPGMSYCDWLHCWLVVVQCVDLDDPVLVYALARAKTVSVIEKCNWRQLVMSLASCPDPGPERAKLWNELLGHEDDIPLTDGGTVAGVEIVVVH